MRAARADSLPAWDGCREGCPGMAEPPTQPDQTERQYRDADRFMKLKIVQLIKTSGILHPPTEGGVSKDQNENRPVQENRYCGITTAVFAHGAPSPLCVISITRSAPLRKGKRSSPSFLPASRPNPGVHFINALLTSTAVVALAEVGDKTQLRAIVRSEEHTS